MPAVTATAAETNKSQSHPSKKVGQPTTSQRSTTSQPVATTRGGGVVKGPIPKMPAPKLLIMAALPPAVRGVQAVTTPTATIAPNGQITLNRLASVAFKGLSHCVFLADGPTDKETGHVTRNSNWVGLRGVDINKLPPGVTADAVLKIQWLKLKGSDERTHAAIAISRPLRGIGYEYSESGRQSFSVDVNEKGHEVLMEVPSGKLTPPPVVKRPRKAVDATAGQSGNTPNPGAPAMQEEELLQEA